MQKLIQNVMKEHKAIIFNGDNYTDDWKKEAARRGYAVSMNNLGLAYAGLPREALLQGGAWIHGLRQNDLDRSNLALASAAEPGDKAQWMDLGSLALKAAGEAKATRIVQLSVNRDGVLRGRNDVAERRVLHDYAGLGGRLEVDVVHSGAGSAANAASTGSASTKNPSS